MEKQRYLVTLEGAGPLPTDAELGKVLAQHLVPGTQIAVRTVPEPGHSIVREADREQQ